MQNYRLPAKPTTRRGHSSVGLLIAGVVIVAVVIGWKVYAHSKSSVPTPASKTVATTASKPTAKTQPAPINQCSGNTLDHLILVSIGQRHMWACNTTTMTYDSAVITGMENLAADLTPKGTYHIYAKYTNTTLTGHDSTGSWNDPVSYWMPFLNNQYGSYGFHDATWRAATDFGKISPYSSQASHGCVETPLAAAKWLYNWATIGTTVTVES